MALPESFLEQLRSRCEIEDIVSEYVTLRRRGKSLVGLCPFHSEKTPSFTLFPETQSFYCFGCGAGGDVITFIRNIENLDYIDAVKFLADKFGLEIPEDKTSEGDYKEFRKQVYEINRLAANYYYKCLLSEEGKEALEYIKKRKLKASTVKSYGLGFAPNSWTGLIDYLVGQGYDKEFIKKAGLCAKSSKGGYYDYFRNRIMFPIIDVRGNVIGFGGRVMDDSQPKYLNSPDTPIFKKSLNLFSLNNAKGSGDVLILCEGYMDVISLYQAGFKNAVATLGTALTPEQARLISRYAKEVVISYDSDEAGRKATTRAIKVLNETGIKVRVLTMGDAKDPDEYIKKYGRDKFALLINASENHIEYKLSALRANYNFDLPEDKVAYLKEAASVIAELESLIEREIYAGQIAKELDTSKEAILAEVKKIKRIEIKKKMKADIREEEKRILAVRDKINPDKAENLKAAKAEEGIICTLFYNPDYMEVIKDRLQNAEFVTSFNKRVFEVICEIIANVGQADTIMLSRYFTPPEMGRISGIIAKKDELCGDEMLEDYIQTLKENYKKKLLKEAEGIDLGAVEQYIKELGKIKGKGSN